MKGQNRQFGLVLAVSATCGLLWSDPAVAQDEPRFRVIELPALGFSPDPYEHGSIAINNKHQVAFSFRVGNDMHGWVYLPEDDYGLLAGIHDLSVLTPGVSISAAWDLTDTGWVCGRANFTMDDPLVTGQAIVWQLGSPLQNCLLGFLPNGEWSVAYAINNDQGSAVIVGDADAGSNPPCALFNSGFWVSFDGQCPAPALIELPPRTDDDGGFARDVSTPSEPQQPRLIVGYSGPPIGLDPIVCGERRRCRDSRSTVAARQLGAVHRPRV